MLQERARQLDDKVCFTVLDGGGAEAERLTYNQLDLRARTLSKRLRATSPIGGRAVLAYPPTTDFIVALFGCLYAGVTAIPVYASKDRRALQRLIAVLEDAEASMVLTSSEVLGSLQEFIDQDDDLQRTHWITTDDASQDPVASWQPPEIGPETLALLQYTSGSTADPRGVMLTHRNLLSNQEMIRQGMGTPSGLTAVNWLPLYHDMGLIGNVLHPLYRSGECVILTPQAFLANPYRWLKAISDYHAFGSGAPSFAYDLCASRVGLEQLQELDLSGWKVAYVGAEPVRYQALERFADKFATCGFRRESFYPCYGLAEATLFVSGGNPRLRPRTIDVASAALEEHRVVEGGGNERRITLTSCGTGRLDERIAIVDSESRECEPGQVGEIWIRGSHVAQGYWGRQQETELTFGARLRLTFGARLSGEDAPYLRTGDLGFVKDGELFVTGRLKDLLIVRGRNHYPQDIECAAQSAHPALIRECGAAFAIDDDDTIVLVNEVNEYPADDWANVAAAVRRSVASECGVDIALVLTPRRVVPKTSSGKVQRRLCRTLYLEDRLDWIWRRDDRKAPVVAGVSGHGDGLTSLSMEDRVERLTAHMLRLVAQAVEQEPASIDLHRPMNQLGLDSLHAIEIMSTLGRDLGVDLRLDDLVGERGLAGLARWLAPQVEPAPTPAFETTTASSVMATPAHGSFPLNDLQRAYCAGRSEEFELGNVSAHVYFEFDGLGLDPDQLQSAWCQLIARHDALRRVVLPTGLQEVLEQSQLRWVLPVIDLRGESADEIRGRLRAVRDEMSHQVIPVDRWPLFDIRAHRLDGDRLRVHISLDLLMLDASGVLQLIDEWGRLYDDPNALQGAMTRHRVAAEQLGSARDSAGYRRALAYWQDRVQHLPAPPRLPIGRHPRTIRHPRFSRRSGRLTHEAWRSLKDRAASAGVTPSAALLAAFGEILATWSDDPRFTVSVTMLDNPRSPQASEVGQFASFNLLEVDGSLSEPFVARARALQRRLWEDLEHRQVDGVRVLRELARAQSLSRSTAKAPVVCTLVLQDLAVFDWLGKPVFGISQTPQVALDNQAFLYHGDLLFHWDAVDEMFPAGLLDDMFSAYRVLLDRLAKDESAWLATGSQVIPEAHLRLRTQVNQTYSPIPDVRLEELFLRQADRYPDRLAVISYSRSLTYQELRGRVAALAWWLRSEGVGPGDIVAIVTEKGWEQAAAVMAILSTKAAYLPLAADLPRARLSMLLQNAGVNLVLTQSRLFGRVSWPSFARVVPVDVVAARSADPLPADLAGPPRGTVDDLCCVYYTSGSTGVPKGVEIRHRGVVNAISHTNEVFRIGPDDRILALTNLHHDMSAFDLFGILAAGGALVVPPGRGIRDPAKWLEMMGRHGVSIWNSVPTSMEMLLEHVEAHDIALPSTLRLAFLGGDWIPLEVPARLRARAPNAEVVSVGGPTETTLWNIWYRIGDVDPDWTSIPYGKPIANTRYYVLDEGLRDRPVWVAGEMCCAGVGVSSGYYRDPQATASKFVVHPRTKDRIYRTGDIGRMLPDGNLEFLGRRDLQVQIDGHRVELREIEACLSRHPAVRSCAVVWKAGAHGRQRLVAHVVPSTNGEASESALRAYLAEQLAPPMIPGQFIFSSSFPQTLNGKINRQALEGLDSREPSPTPGAGSSAAEAAVTAIVEKVLSTKAVSPELSLDEMGVSSLEMLRIANLLEERFAFRPEIEDMFSLSTVGALAGFYQRHLEGNPIHDPAQDRSETARPCRAEPPILLDRDQRDQFRRAQLGVRNDLGRWASVLALPTPGLTTVDHRRGSSRDFLPSPIPLDAFSSFLGQLRQVEAAGDAHRNYASGGGAYAVQVYLHVKPGRIEGVPDGAYYYNPQEHTMVSLGSADGRLTKDIHWWSNREAFERAAFSIYLIAQMNAVRPLYGDRSLHFVTIEAGLIAQLLEMSAPSSGLGLCQIGGLDFANVADIFRLDAGHTLVHSLVGGQTGDDGLASAASGMMRSKATILNGRNLATTDNVVANAEDLRSKAVLKHALDVSAAAPQRRSPPQTVLVTGATGFLGAFLVEQLLTRTSARLICLVRAADPASAWHRIQRSADRFGIGLNGMAGRVTALAGDISRPQLGLADKDYDDLALSVDAVYHCAARVNWVLPYSAIEAVTVGGVQEILRLCARGRVKPIHYVSTLAVFPFDGTSYEEGHNLDHRGRLLGGYAQSKWVAERLMSEAATGGFPIAIYRPSVITGHSVTGAFAVTSYLENIVKGCIELGEAPQLGGVLDIVPVDFAAAAIAQLSLDNESLGRVFHLNNPSPLEMEAFFNWIRARGYLLRSRAFEQWKQDLVTSPRVRDNALYPFLTLLTQSSRKDMTMGHHRCENTLDALKGSGVSCPAVDQRLLQTYFDFFIDAGFLVAPAGEHSADLGL
jgi:amino acid adenylation domain-containing protein/thioester reductase-like protein